MKILLNIPKWANNRRILGLADGEVIAKRDLDDETLMLKTTRCNLCGQCCMDYPRTIFGCDDEGKCKMLIKDHEGNWNCEARGDRPLNCLYDPVMCNYPECCITYKEAE